MSNGTVVRCSQTDGHNRRASKQCRERITENSSKNSNSKLLEKSKQAAN